MSKLQKLNIKNIVVFRARSLSEMLQAIPSIKEIRTEFPNAKISFVAFPWMRTFFNKFENLIDEFIEFPGFPGLSEKKINPEKTLNFLASVQSKKFDLAIQMQESEKITDRLISLFKAKNTMTKLVKAVDKEVLRNKSSIKRFSFLG